MLDEIVVADWLLIEPLDLGEHFAWIGSAKIVVRVQDNRVIAVGINQNVFAADEVARTRA